MTSHITITCHFFICSCFFIYLLLCYSFLGSLTALALVRSPSGDGRVRCLGLAEPHYGTKPGQVEVKTIDFRKLEAASADAAPAANSEASPRPPLDFVKGDVEAFISMQPPLRFAKFVCWEILEMFEQIVRCVWSF